MQVVKKIASVGATLSATIFPAIAHAQINANPLPQSGLPTKDIRLIVSAIINAGLSLIGVVLVIIMLYAGFLWMTAGGDSDKVDSAKKWIYGGIIGLVIIMSSYAISQFVISSLITATT